MKLCAWCGIEMKAWRVLLRRKFCGDCSTADRKYSDTGTYHGFHSRLGQREAK